MNRFSHVYGGRRVLVTGHTGFKGSWLALWLSELGAEVTGIALDPPSTPNHWDLLGLSVYDQRLDVRDTQGVANIVARVEPEIVFHLAAQPLVRRSYREPLETWSTNVVGTANVLEACRATPAVRAIVVVTSDKCYENRGLSRPYRETDALGGRDPYSASKAAAELVASSYRQAFFDDRAPCLVATARAGNVIGGGDWAEDRLIPDLVRAHAAGRPLAVRSPESTRPWQHVLECLKGYLQLAEHLFNGERSFASSWNFGPDAEDKRSVREVVDAFQRQWPGVHWRHEPSDGAAPEARTLELDSTKARTMLVWRPVWSVDEAIAKTAAWHRQFAANATVTSRDQLREFVATVASLEYSAQ